MNVKTFTRNLGAEIGWAVAGLIVAGLFLGGLFALALGVNGLLAAYGFAHPAAPGAVFLGTLLIALIGNVVYRAWKRTQKTNNCEVDQ